MPSSGDIKNCELVSCLVWISESGRRAKPRAGTVLGQYVHAFFTYTSFKMTSL